MANPLFDRFVIIDWSASNKATSGADSIWVADSHQATRNISTRAATITHIRTILDDCLHKGARLLIGWDFAFGYPVGFADALGLSGWQGVWDYLSDRIEHKPDNQSNRFDVAARINRSLGNQSGPFWGYLGKDCPDGLSPKRYPDGIKRPWPFERFDYLRQIERHVPSASPVFKLAYTGSVGSQALLGIPRLNHLRRSFPDEIAIWPFETGFANNLCAPVVFTEIYPSAHAVPDGTDVKDKRQVEAVLRDFSAWNETGTLQEKLNAPSLSGKLRQTVLREEGWVVGQ